MKISIITPTYNSGKTLERTILSVINQPLDAELEYIIIDGGSTDDTLAIINRYSKHIDVLVSEKDRGTYDAMNKGISMATGTIVGIINSDDWYNEDALRSVEMAFNTFPTLDIIHSPVKNYINDKYISTFMPGDLAGLPFKLTIAHPSCFVKKELYDRVGLFDLSYSMAADYDFIFRSYTSGANFHSIDLPLASFSMNGMTGKLKNRLKLIRESKRVASNYLAESSLPLRLKHHSFYTNWMAREILTFPLKSIDPVIALKVKKVMRKRLGVLVGDQYGAW